ncbi:MAG TPA: Flp family type IVb pilin [Stellaceae bacterium]|nr:Flp family type IVb pilin [Stellaceae bacterium]
MISRQAAAGQGLIAAAAVAAQRRLSLPKHSVARAWGPRLGSVRESVVCNWPNFSILIDVFLTNKHNNPFVEKQNHGRHSMLNLWNLMVLKTARDESGATAIEYGLIAALIAVAAITAFQLVGSNLSSLFNTIGSDL